MIGAIVVDYAEYTQAELCAEVMAVGSLTLTNTMIHFGWKPDLCIEDIGGFLPYRVRINWRDPTGERASDLVDVGEFDAHELINWMEQAQSEQRWMLAPWFMAARDFLALIDAWRDA